MSPCLHMSHSSLELCCSYPIKEQTWALSCHRPPPRETKSQNAQRRTWAPSQYSTDAQHPNSQPPHPTALPFSAGSQLEPPNWKHAPPSQVTGSQMPCLEWLVPQTHSNRPPATGTPPPPHSSYCFCLVICEESVYLSCHMVMSSALRAKNSCVHTCIVGGRAAP